MLLNVSAQVRECGRHAEECARQAKAQTNPKFQQEFLDLERRWLRLAPQLRVQRAAPYHCHAEH